MTEQEQKALQQLELNLERIGELTRRQGALIQRLHKELEASQQQVASLTEQLAQAEAHAQLERIATQLSAPSAEERAEARAYLADIIKDIESCIRLLRK